MTRHVVQLVRHASAGVRGTWPGPDLERPLDARGSAHAEALAIVLAPGATGLVTSAAVRCRETLVPLAAATGLDLVDEPLLLEGSDPIAALRWLEAQADGTVACTHGDVLTGILVELAAVGVVPEDPPTPKSGRWVLDVVDGEVVAGAFHGPPD